jgi:hypothetical protein
MAAVYFYFRFRVYFFGKQWVRAGLYFFFDLDIVHGRVR